MTRAIQLVRQYRNAATLAIAGVVALLETLQTQHGSFVLSLARSLKYFIFVFVVCAVILAVVFTAVLVALEHREAQRAAPDLPRAAVVPRLGDERRSESAVLPLGREPVKPVIVSTAAPTDGAPDESRSHSEPNLLR